MKDKYSKLMSKYYRIKMSDGSIWAVPVGEIATNRAEHFMYEYGDDLVKSLYEDTLPLFDSNESAIKEWACNNMTWQHVSSFATMITPPKQTQLYVSDWTNANETRIF